MLTNKTSHTHKQIPSLMSLFVRTFVNIHAMAEVEVDVEASDPSNELVSWMNYKNN
jgi:hypothetical protein